MGNLGGGRLTRGFRGDDTSSLAPPTGVAGSVFAAPWLAGFTKVTANAELAGRSSGRGRSSPFPIASLSLRVRVIHLIWSDLIAFSEEAGQVPVNGNTYAPRARV